LQTSTSHPSIIRHKSLNNAVQPPQLSYQRSVPLCSLVAFWNIHLQAATRPPTTALRQVLYGIVECCKQDNTDVPLTTMSLHTREDSIDTCSTLSTFGFHDYSQNQAQHTDTPMPNDCNPQLPSMPSRYSEPPAPIMYIKQGTSHAGCQSIAPSHGITYCTSLV
jgi:hypothetical protein